MGRRGRNLLRGPALLAFAAFTGCSGCGGCTPAPDAYPAAVAFAPRADWVVVELPKEAPPGDDPPGELEESVRKANQHGGKVLDPAAVPAGPRDELNRFVRDTFGTPAKPAVAGDPEATGLAAGLGLTEERLAAGSRLYRDRCQECHGLAGDGRGPTAPWLTPHPRDYRAGTFKFTSTGKKPTRADLFRTLTNGLKPTAMPSFGMRTEEERERLIDYVTFLSVRGKTELDVLKSLLVHGEEGLSGTVAEEAAAVLKAELRAWAAADSQVIPATPAALAAGSPELAESVRRGHALFVDPKGGGCVACHADYGRDARYQYDVWGTRIKPAPLTDVPKKGGDAPEQLFRRLRGGIPPSNMPAATALTDAQAWDLVYFLRALPYPDRLPDDVRGRVYGGR
jgi:mono/diheme cytochrome c family protein